MLQYSSITESVFFVTRVRQKGGDMIQAADPRFSLGWREIREKNWRKMIRRRTLLIFVTILLLILVLVCHWMIKGPPRLPIILGWQA